jgi:uncharacterized protein (DUF362 family)
MLRPHIVNETFETIKKPVVSVVKIKDDKIAFAVEKAIDLLGGIETVTRGKELIMLKPNLVTEDPAFTTNPKVIRTLTQLMKRSGKEVLIGEGSSQVNGFSVREGVAYRVKNRKILDEMQQFVFDKLGYTELGRLMDVPLINLHSGELVDVQLTNGFVFDKITLHRSLVDIDMLCSVPMMKTHKMATVTLGLKNLMGLYPGIVYQNVRGWVHDYAAEAGSPGIAFEIVDMARVNKLGLVVVDASVAMQGDGPTKGGELVQMNLIIAGRNPLATDMVAAYVMGFETDEVPTFIWANKAGMQPQKLDEIEVRGETLDNVKRELVKPRIIPWKFLRRVWARHEIP